MSFVEIQQSEIQEGAPVTQNLFQKIKDNFDEHEEQIQEAKRKALIYSLIFGG